MSSVDPDRPALARRLQSLGRTGRGAHDRMPERVFLTGFMGCGKTTLGRLLADRLEWRFVDLDEAVEHRTGLPVRRIFAAFGERRFRRLEHEALLATAREPGRSIVALGGGAFVSEVNRAVIRRSGVSIWIDVPFRTLVRRVGGDRSRPLARSPEELYTLYRARVPFYFDADLRIRAGDAAPELVARKLLRWLREDWDAIADRRRMRL
jgi:shikimate kinase